MAIKRRRVGVGGGLPLEVAVGGLVVCLATAAQKEVEKPQCGDTQPLAHSTVAESSATVT